MIKVAINGFGRIGRQVYRRISENHPNMEVVAINDLTDDKTLLHLLRHDSSYGFYDGKLPEKVFAEKDPEKLPWKSMEVDIVLECTGLFTTKEGGEKHIKAGAKKVIISGPCKDTAGYVLGVNTDSFDISKDDVFDMGSCTTNCLAPIAKILNDNFVIQKGFMTTVHSYTNDQKILDLPHKDLRRARAAAVNIIPTSTGAAKAIGKMIPELNGKLDGISMRVPTPVVSSLDVIVVVEKETTVEEVNEVFKKASASKNFKGILRVEEEELVSTDFKGDSYSSILDANLTMVNGNLVKVVGWYDNEWGFSCRLAEFTEFVAEK
ncbi:MAG: type I glyceraldehyde-3-phosphate dehydrogenase [Candidatus Staskawiczbacteria bacterium]|nr:type I glyceraldehyde-3-phosphate dehydrogenase [Candidatus Staskawiczbacteria bacterium]